MVKIYSSICKAILLSAICLSVMNVRAMEAEVDRANENAQMSDVHYEARCEASLWLAEHYAEGADKNPVEAKKYYELLIRQAQNDVEKCAPAWLALGKLYYSGVLGESNYEEALNYFLKAHGQKVDKNIYAQSLKWLGELYKFGHGVVKDNARALDYYREASEQTDSPGARAFACVRIGEAYLFAEGLPKDLKEAHQFFEKALNQTASTGALARAWRRLGDMYYDCLIEGEKEDNYAKAREFYGKAANQNDHHMSRTAALWKLGHIYYFAHGVARDYGVAGILFKLAVDGKDAPRFRANACFRLGEMYSKGQGVTRNYSEAQRLLEQAINQEESDFARISASFLLGSLLLQGKGELSKQEARAHELLLIARDQQIFATIATKAEELLSKEIRN